MILDANGIGFALRARIDIVGAQNLVTCSDTVPESSAFNGINRCMEKKLCRCPCFFILGCQLPQVLRNPAGETLHQMIPAGDKRITAQRDVARVARMSNLMMQCLLQRCVAEASAFALVQRGRKRFFVDEYQIIGAVAAHACIKHDNTQTAIGLDRTLCMFSKHRVFQKPVKGAVYSAFHLRQRTGIAPSVMDMDMGA